MSNFALWQVEIDRTPIMDGRLRIADIKIPNQKSEIENQSQNLGL
jgi:hypothetical protein